MFLIKKKKPIDACSDIAFNFWSAWLFEVAKNNNITWKPAQRNSWIDVGLLIEKIVLEQKYYFITYIHYCGVINLAKLHSLYFRQKEATLVNTTWLNSGGVQTQWLPTLTYYEFFHSLVQ